MKLAANLWTSFSKEALDWIYPSKCALCGLLEESSPCRICASQMELAIPNFVSEGSGALDYRACVYSYSGRAAQAVRQLKYSRSTSLVEFMSSRVAERLKQVTDPDEVLIPVPIHRSRRAIRGFNQAELVSTGNHGLRVESHWLKRIRATKPQAGLSLKERQSNLQNAFVASADVNGLRLVLIDDVVTSGYTARECAKVLTNAGAASVGIVAFCGNLD